MVHSNRICWHFTSAVEPERAARLLAWLSFTEIIERFSTCKIAPLYWEPATSPNLIGCSRASFEVLVEPALYDAFFNSPVGYRGQFAKSETAGEAADRKLVDTLFQRLIDAAAGHATATPHLVTSSLQGKQAKVWIVESEVDHQLTDPHASIVFPPWEFNAPDGQGLRAPLGTKLEVKGGWLDSMGHEVFNASKKHRSGHIYRTGDSK